MRRGQRAFITPPRLQPPSGRPGRNTRSDVQFQVEGIPVYGEVKQFPDPWLRGPGAPAGREALRPIDLYCKLQEGKVPVPEKFPKDTVNLLFMFHASFDPLEALEQALFGWGEARLHSLCLPAEHQQADGLFAREEWRGISGCCLCRVRGGELRFLHIWENPRAPVSIPPQVYSALRREAGLGRLHSALASKMLGLGHAQ